ncbi:MAG TPA: hypothetical protein DCM67_05670, partial [Propionibacteriaceae bacterium]|nr:hypothetical protein [Propionibacteriaceae bacterium]
MVFLQMELFLHLFYALEQSGQLFKIILEFHPFPVRHVGCSHDEHIVRYVFGDACLTACLDVIAYGGVVSYAYLSGENDVVAYGCAPGYPDMCN